MGRQASSEDLRAPGLEAGSEEVVGSRDRALAELLDPQSVAQLREGDSTQIRAPQRVGVETEIRLGLRPLGGAAADLPAALVPLAERVGDLEHDRLAVPVATGSERRFGIDDADPEPVPHAIARS